MFQEMINIGSGGSGTAEFKDATISGTNFTCSWDYNAEVVILFFTISTTKYIFMYDLSTKDLWYTTTGAAWSHQGIDSRITTSPTSISGSYGENISSMSVIPITNKPQGYFT